MAKQVPYIPQMEVVECGAASLSMVLAYYGHHAPLSEVRKACGVSRDGATALQVLRAAKNIYNFNGKARRMPKLEQLATLTGPAILHWRMEHFVVLEKYGEKESIIVDPGMGRRFVSTEELDRCFTGICLELTPNEHFKPREKDAKTRMRYLAMLRGTGGALGIVLGTALALNLLALAIPIATKVVLDRVVVDRHESWLGVIIASLLGLVTMTAVYSALRARILLRLRGQLDVAITSAFVEHMLSLPIAFFGQRTTADLMGRVAGNRAIRELLTGHALGLLVDGAMMIVSLALMLLFDVRLGLVVVAAAALYVVAYALARRPLAAAAATFQLRMIRASNKLLQVLRGIATIKSSGAERGSRSAWLNAYILLLNSGTKKARTELFVGTVLGLLRSAVPVVILYLGGVRVLAGELTAGSLVAFQFLQSGFLAPLEQVIGVLVMLQSVPVLIDRMDDVLTTKTETSGEAACPQLEGEIAFEHISFSYNDAGPQILDDINLVIPKGKKVAFVGASGSGKSTLARLLLGLYEPTTGRILLDGHNLAELDIASVRRQFGVVLQETALFDGTIAENLRLFAPNAPMEHVVQAARVAQIHDDIQALPQGYETRIASDRGALSGGQRQRLSLARAILHRPPIMVLDEATSALDAVTEVAIERYLSTRSCTRVVIAHRLSTIRDADLIVVFDQGTIAERGTHAELMALGGVYARLVSPPKVDVLEPIEEGGSALKRARPKPDDLMRFAVFDGFTEEQRVELAKELAYTEFAPNTVLLQQDASPTALYLLASGNVDIELSEPGLPSWKVAELGAGSIVGEVGLLDGSPNSATVTARTHVVALEITRTRFHQLLHKGDSLAIGIEMSLGKLVAQRLRDALNRLEEASAESPREDDAVTTGGGSGGRSMRLRETLLGAALSSAELASITALGNAVKVRQGEKLFVKDSPANAVYAMLSGRITTRLPGVRGAVDTLDPGEVLGEASIFEEGTWPVTAVADSEAVVFMLPREAVRNLILSGQVGAAKVLEALTLTLVRQLRGANFRLREAVALSRGEVERAHAAREQGLAAAKAERAALLAGSTTSDDERALVRTDDPTKALAACLATFLRTSGRAVSLARIEEMFALTGLPAETVFVRVARGFGLDTRRLSMNPSELTTVEHPLAAVLKNGAAVLIQSRNVLGTWRLLDPVNGPRVVTTAQLEEELSDLAFELRPDISDERAESLGARILGFARGRVRDIARIVALTLGVQAVSIAASLTTAIVIDRALPLGDRGMLDLVVIATAVLVLASTASGVITGWAIEHLRTIFDRELVDQLMVHLLRLPISFFDKNPAGNVLQRFVAFEKVRALLAQQGVALAFGLITMVSYGALMMAFGPKLVMLPVLGLGVFAVIAWICYPRLRRNAAAELRARSAQEDRLIEVVSGAVTLRMSGDKTLAHQRWLPTLVDETTKSLAQERLYAWALPLINWVHGSLLVACLYFSARGVLEGSMTLGALVAFLSVSAGFLGVANGLTMGVLDLAVNVVDVSLVRETFAERPEQAPGVTAPGQLRGRITLDSVSFRYSESDPWVLRDVSLDIPSGAKVALVGSSGSGKSTLGKLLLGLYLPSSGRILFDGRDVTSLDLPAVRSQMGVVLQEPYLLSANLRENLGLGNEADSPEQLAMKVVVAAQKAAIHDDIMKLPMGYSTVVSEGGGGFSGGQRQRCVIARALVNEPAVMLLDEATSALDNVTQSVVEESLSRLSATRVVIAHRLSTVVDADVIVVLEKGRVIEQGKHDELMARRGYYYALISAQEPEKPAAPSVIEIDPSQEISMPPISLASLGLRPPSTTP